MHAIAHEGCTNTVRESALKVDYGRNLKTLVAPENRTRVSIAPGLSVQRSSTFLPLYWNLYLILAHGLLSNHNIVRLAFIFYLILTRYLSPT